MALQHSIIRLLLGAHLSLADLQSATQVSLPTLRRAVQELADARWIRVVGQAEANGGRPAMLFGVDSSRFVIVGAHLQLPGMRLILSDLTGQIIEETELFDSAVPTPSAAVQAMIDYAEHVRTDYAARQLLGIGIAAPGFIDLNTGDVISIGRVPSWESFPIRRRLQMALNLPVNIANDVDCMAFAELQHVHEPRESNLAYVGFDEGVKVSLFLKGGLYKGTLGNAGLIDTRLLQGYDPLSAADAPNLLTINGVNHSFEELMATLDAAERQRYAAIAAKGTLRERASLIMADAALPVCDAIVQQQIKVLAVAVANVILLIQPDVVIIGGLLSLLPRGSFMQLELAIRRSLPELISNNTTVRQGTLAAQSSAASGASLHFLQLYLEDEAEILT